MARNPCPSVAESAECITNRIHQVTSPPTSSFLPSSPNQPPTTHPEFRNGRILFHPLRLNFNCYCEDDFQAVIFPPSSLHPPHPPASLRLSLDCQLMGSNVVVQCRHQWR